MKVLEGVPAVAFSTASLEFFRGVRGERVLQRLRGASALDLVAPFRQPLADGGFLDVSGRLVEPRTAQLVGQVLLGDVIAGEIVRILVPARVPHALHQRRGRVAQLERDRQRPFLEHRRARLRVRRSVVLLFGEVATNVAACVIGNTPSGSPTSSNARSASTATNRARGPALPTSSLAKMTIRRNRKRGSSPDSSMRTS